MNYKEGSELKFSVTNRIWYFGGTDQHLRVHHKNVKTGGGGGLGDLLVCLNEEFWKTKL